MSDRIAVMNAGRVEQLGTPREVYEQPRTRFVADFIGTSNLLTAPVERLVDGDAVLAVGGEQRLVVPLRSETATAGEALDVTVRPEKIRIGAEMPEADCRLLGRVHEVVYQGTFTGYAVSTDATRERVLVHAQNSHDSHDLAAEGDEVWLSWNKDHSYLIRSPTGKEPT
jgi:spermidine/putrescine transport system ATP-binding protein